MIVVQRFATQFLSTCVSIVFTDTSAQAGGPINTDDVGLAANGFDVVAMFDQQVSKGKERYRVDRNSVIYLFSSSDNKDRFVSEPEKYTLAYGGYCAYGVRMGQKLQIDPNSFVVQGGSGSASLW